MALTKQENITSNCTSTVKVLTGNKHREFTIKVSDASLPQLTITIGNETKSFAYLSVGYYPVNFSEKVFNYTADTDIVISSTNWNGASLNIYELQDPVIS